MNNKRWLSILLALLLMAVALPTAALAANGPGPGALPAENDDTTLVGPVVAKADTIPGDWTIADEVVAITPQTRFMSSPMSIKVGDVVEVKVEQRDEKLVAREIRKVANAVGRHVEGEIKEIGDGFWMVDDVKVLILASTEFYGDDPDVGDFATAWGKSTDEGFEAKRVVVRDRPDEVDFVGSIKSMTDEAWEITTPLGDVTVAIAAETEIEGDSPEVGDIVRVHAKLTDSGLIAMHIAVMEPETDVHFGGVIKEMNEGAWVIQTRMGERTVTISDETEIEGNEPEVGAVVEVWAVATPEGLTAKRIVVQDEMAVGVRFAGIIASMTDDAWVITTFGGERTVAITDDTEISGDPADVGDHVEVSSVVTADGLVAQKLEVHDSPKDMHFRGRIVELTPNSWQIGRQRVGIDNATVIEGDSPDVGDMAEVWAQRTPEGLLATRIVVSDLPAAERPVVVRGTVEAIVDDTWTVAGETVMVMEDTVVVGEPGVGDEVVVVGKRMEGGAIAASSIFAVSQDETSARFSGLITAITPPASNGDPTEWTVESAIVHNGEHKTWRVLITPDTAIHPNDATPAVGMWVKGAGVLADDESIIAEMVQVTPPPTVPFAGEIQQQPADGVLGEWVINGVRVLVTAETRVIDEPAEWNGKAQGQGVLQGDGSVKALVIGPYRF